MSLNLIQARAAALKLTLLALVAVPLAAQASNFPNKVRRPYSAPPPPPVHQWTGFYAGANVGYGIAGISDNAPLAITSVMTGVIGGVQAGYNYQWDHLVLGIEADIQASAQRVSYSRNLPFIGDLTVGHRIPYFGTARARVGFAFTCGCVMAYGTVGVAYGAYEPFASIGGVTLSQRFTKTALAAGAGVEWMIAERWSTKLEALYLDTGNIGEGITLPVLGTIHMRVRDAVTRIAVNYHF